MYLRARWYAAGRGVFGSRDPFAGWSELPYSLHPYQYASGDPVRLSDPSGKTPNPLPCLALALADTPVPGPADVAALTCVVIVGSLAVVVSLSTWRMWQQVDPHLPWCPPDTSSPPRTSDQGGNTAPNPPAPTPPPGIGQEARVRTQLAQDYDQPYGYTDEAIRTELGLKKTDKVADFVGQHRIHNNWLIAESKGSHVEVAVKQLQTTMDALIGKHPSAAGNIELHVYMNEQQFTRALDVSGNGLGGYHVDTQGYLVYPSDEAFIRETVNGLLIRVFKAP